MGATQSNRPPEYRGITHVALLVKDPEQSTKWYEDVLGLTCVVRDPIASFLSFSGKHHDIALIKARAELSPWSVGLHHFAMEIKGDASEMRRIHAGLVAKDVKIDRVVDHGIGWGIYFYDPDGNRLEFFCNRPGRTEEEAQKFFHESGAPSDSIDISDLRTTVE